MKQKRPIEKICRIDGMFAGFPVVRRLVYRKSVELMIGWYR